MSLLTDKNFTDDMSDDLSDNESTKHPLTEIFHFSIIAILIVIPIRMFVAQPFIVSGASMDDTFATGQYLIVDQLTYHFEKPERGDVVIFRPPIDLSKFYIKRVIGIPGDTIIIDKGEVTIKNEGYPDGFVLDETYIKEMSPAPKLTEILGDREYFVMGDNRNQSSDSRSWGILQEELIIGRALVRLFPPNAVSYLPGAVEIKEKKEKPIDEQQ